ncbi:uncharacterized protein GGS22DRAFT_189677 [Annulohypoxylon maeteangense]|uniref:uncharacterized protein n=1 Tax=Annulohypoxylon maeteangense TaxID=1927788 RepID=UPI00200729AB|nr:uncharacterized protein GGS22DRAFT_189677 [Annulohypoxylon maeteangense]KAI0883711.1 hypothetical protein GGS22DRAFT_189677 [Annulohypoxylon maeteangense]
MPPYAYINTCPYPYLSATDDSPKSRMKRQMLCYIVILFASIAAVSAVTYIVYFRQANVEAALVVMYCFVASTIISGCLWISLHCIARRKRRAARNKTPVSRRAGSDVERRPIQLQNLNTTTGGRVVAPLKTPEIPAKSRITPKGRYPPPVAVQGLQTIAIE